MLFGTCRRASFILVASVLLLGAEMACSETLREALAAKNLPVAGAKLENLDKNITSGAILDDESQFLIAYYIDDGTSALNPPLYLERFDRKQGSWKGATLEKAEARSENMDVPCLGSIMNVTAVGNRFFFDTHINPSAGCMLIVSSDLQLEACLYGWLVGRLGSETVIYHRSQIHFAPVHPAEIAVHDLRTKDDVTLFPPRQESPIRQARTQRLQSFYKGNQEWCNKNNDPCDPAYFDSALEGPVATNTKEQALAFLISYEQIQLVQGELQKPDGPKDVLYVYRRVGEEGKMEYREMLLEDAKKRFGELSLQNLLKPEVLQKVFNEEPVKRP
jgi:hypothetical protein